MTTNRSSRFFWCGLLVLGTAAQSSGLPTLSEVAVIGSSQELLGEASSASQGTVLPQQLRNRPLLRPGELLETVPGLIATQHSGDGKANQFFLRGFNLDHGTDFATFVAGMPVNLPSHAHGQGYTDLNFVIPELVARVQYQKGPYFADVGDFATAGNARIDYVKTLEQGIAEAGLGSDGWRRLLLAHAAPIQQGQAWFALESFGNQGPWDSPEHLRKLNGVARIGQSDGGQDWSLTAMLYRARWNATDQIPQRAVEQGLIGRYGNLDSSDGGNTHRYSLSADWTRRGGNAITTAQAYWIDYRLRLYSNFTYLLNDPGNGDQFQQSDRRQVLGGQVSHTWYGTFGGFDTRQRLGVQVRHDRIAPVGLYATAERQVLGTIREDQVRQTSLGAYFENATTWHEKLNTVLGARFDIYQFNVASSQPQNSGKRHAGIANPKLSVVLGPWAKTEFYLNAGGGFHSNDARGTTLRVDPASGDAASSVTPLARAKGYELGLRSALLPNLQTTFNIWRLDLASELLFVGDAGSTEASRPSRRQGVEWTHFWMPRPGVIIDADLSWSRARFRDADPAGNYIPGAIEKTVSVGMVVEHGPWSGGLRLRYFGPRPLQEDNAVRSSGSTLINAQLGYRWDNHTQISLAVFNLTNRNVNDIEYVYASRLPGEGSEGVVDRHFHPAEPRSARLTLQHRF